jgi:hypothetical protein
VTQRARRDRRTFLRAVGAGFASLPFFRLLENSVARAAGEELPLNFLTVYHPHGIAAEYWAMREGDTETAFDITYENCSLQPFDDAATYGKSFKDKILVIQGTEMFSNANGHDTAGTILTGSRIDGSLRRPAIASLDQYLAVELGLGSSTRVTSVALGVGTDATDPGVTLSYGPGGAPLPKIIDPSKAFELLFGNFVGQSDDPAAAAAAERKRRLGKSVIDFVREDVNRLSVRLAAEEKLKLDQHLTSLREIEKQFEDTPTGGAVCQKPTAPDASQWTDEFGQARIKQYNGGEPHFDAITNAHIDMLAHAVACGITRFGTLLMGDLSYEGNPLGLPADNHGSVAHTYSPSTIGNDGHMAAGTPSTWLPLAAFNRYSFGKIARLMQKLDELGVLDNTLIYAASDMGNPSSHSTRNVPVLLAGGANGKFRMGRRLNLGADCPPDNEWCGENVINNRPNSHLLVSIAQAFGAEIDTFGSQPDEALITGRLTELD